VQPRKRGAKPAGSVVASGAREESLEGVQVEPTPMLSLFQQGSESLGMKRRGEVQKDPGRAATGIPSMIV
jgi:hypothetical protein